MGHHHAVARPGYHDGLDVIIGYGNRRAFLCSTGEHTGRHGRNVIQCRDGFIVSVIAGQGTYCRPRPSLIEQPEGWWGGETSPRYRGPYTQVEVGYPSQRPEPWDQWGQYAQDGEQREWDGIYPYVPVALVRDLLNRHGGFWRFVRQC